jgi:hypothetical protein
MYKILIGASIGIVFILCLRSHKENETIPVFNYEEREEIYNGDSTNYLKECWEAQNNKRKDCKGIDPY